MAENPSVDKAEPVPCVDTGHSVTLHASPPEGIGWVPWAAERAPEAELWVNEDRREILIFEGGTARRLGAPDATSFALEVADVERYYGASPMGGRDSGAMLSAPTRGTGARSPALTAFVCVYVFLTVALAFALARANTMDRRAGARGEFEDRGWMEWAAAHGSPQLRDAIDERLPADELYRRDIKRALAPDLAGAARCPSGVTYDRNVDIEYDAARRIFLQAGTLAEATTLQFPADSSVRVEPPVGCWLPSGRKSGACIPVSFVRGDFSVATCYLLDTAVGQ